MPKGRRGGHGSKHVHPRVPKRGNPRTAQRPRKGLPDANLFWSDEMPANTMQDVARNTANTAAHWDQDSKLRDRPVRFVCGGFIEPLEEPELKQKAELTIDEENLVPSLPTATPTISTPPTGNAIAESGPADGEPDSSEDEILFKGRGASRLDLTTKIKPADSKGSTLPSKPSNTTGRDLSALIGDSDEGDESCSDGAVSDYIANMLLDDMRDTVNHTMANARDLGGEATSVFVDVGNPSSEDSDRVCESNDDSITDETEDADIDDSEDDLEEAQQLDDKEMARLLAKQEELGLDADDLILFDGESARTKKPNRKAVRKNKAHVSKHLKTLGPWSQNTSFAYDFRKGGRGKTGSYPSAEAVADAFERLNMSTMVDDLDGPDFGLSDPELEAHLAEAWQKDRIRKKEKKKARQELRERGLLGKGGNATDPRVRYPNGMDLDDIRAEFKKFLLGSVNSVTFSPMDSASRKAVHELAYRFNIKSNSTGSGDQRRPAIVRKKDTLKYNESHFEAVFSKAQRRFYPRLDRDGNGRTGKESNRGGNIREAIVRNGEIVGGSAPEIGAANKGHAMLQKMGWSMGMALGADNNGRTQPIEHVVKRSKAGLG